MTKMLLGVIATLFLVLFIGAWQVSRLQESLAETRSALDTATEVNESNLKALKQSQADLADAVESYKRLNARAAEIAASNADYERRLQDALADLSDADRECAARTIPFSLLRPEGGEGGADGVRVPAGEPDGAEGRTPVPP